MKNQQVVIDYWTMIQTSCIYLVLVFFGWIFIRLVYAIFWLPKHLQKNQENLQRLQQYLDRKFETTDKKLQKNDKNNDVNNKCDLLNTNKDITACNTDENSVVAAINSSATDTNIVTSPIILTPHKEITNPEENLLIKKDK